MKDWQTQIRSKWEASKPIAIALGVGLVAGPIISNFAGWQVTAGTAQAQMRAGVVEQIALYCEERARAEVKESAKLDWSARNDLAKKWAIVPGAASADTDATYACAQRLAV